MQQQSKSSFLPFALLVLAVAIVLGAWMVAATIRSTSDAQIAAQQRAATTSAVHVSMPPPQTSTTAQQILAQQQQQRDLQQALQTDRLINQP